MSPLFLVPCWGGLPKTDPFYMLYSLIFIFLPAPCLPLPLAYGEAIRLFNCAFELVVVFGCVDFFGGNGIWWI